MYAEGINMNYIRICFLKMQCPPPIKLEKYTPYFLPHCQYVNHGFLLGISSAFPIIGKPLGPGGKGRACRLLRNMQSNTTMKKDMRSVHARARLEKDPMMENSMLVETK
jgi:hypothetical protein